MSAAQGRMPRANRNRNPLDSPLEATANRAARGLSGCSLRECETFMASDPVA